MIKGSFNIETITDDVNSEGIRASDVYFMTN